MSEPNNRIAHLLPDDDRRFEYDGRGFDADATLYSTRCNQFDATMGRWIDEDALGFESDGLNQFRYVDDAPHGTGPDREPSE